MVAPSHRVALPDTAAELRRHAAELRAQAAKLDALADRQPDTTVAKVYGLSEMSHRRNLSACTLRSWARSGRLRCDSGPRGQYLVSDADVDAALAAEAPARVCTRPSNLYPFDAIDRELATGGLVRRAA